jgi:hypothetical protein
MEIMLPAPAPGTVWFWSLSPADGRVLAMRYQSGVTCPGVTRAGE